ncbi:helix-turn-helix domain-containing protein [Streptomyces niveus]
MPSSRPFPRKPPPPSSSSVKEAAKALGQRLREIRKNAGLTARALARQAGWHESKCSRFESGNRRPSEAGAGRVNHPRATTREAVRDVRRLCPRRVALDLCDRQVATGLRGGRYATGHRTGRPAGGHRHRQDPAGFRDPGAGVPGLLGGG